ncbi:TRAP transporter substrate-binding protein DctP [Chloroflexota bacterium]
MDIEPVSLLLACTYVKHDPKTEAYVINFLDRVKEITNDRLRIDFRGPELFGGGEIFPAVSRGVVDMGYVAPYTFIRTVPEGIAIYLSQMDYPDEEAIGLTAMVNEYVEKENVHYVGRMSEWGVSDGYFNLGTVKKVDTMEGLKGLRIVAAPPYGPVAEKLGMTLVDVPDPEIFGALETGLADGSRDPIDTVITWSAHEVLHYMVDPGYGRQGATSLYINLEVWNNLDPYYRDVIIEAQSAVAAQGQVIGNRQIKESRQALKDLGVEFVMIDNPEEYRRISIEGDIAVRSKDWDPAFKQKMIEIGLLGEYEFSDEF